MLPKDTTKIVEELGLCPDFKTFYDENKVYMVQSSLSDMLQQLLTEKGLKKSQVIKNTELSEVYSGAKKAPVSGDRDGIGSGGNTATAEMRRLLHPVCQATL